MSFTMVRMGPRVETVQMLSARPEPVGDVRQQTAQVLRGIDRQLEQAGIDRSRVLSAMVWLADMALYDEHDAVWRDWIGPDSEAPRACLTAPLSQPGVLVEIMVTAAR